MKRVYLLLTIIGFILPSVFVVMEGLDSGNWLFYRDITSTVKGMFANNYSSAFVMDLLFVVVLFIFWSYREANKFGLRRIWLIWLWTFAFGIASGLPLFLFCLERKKEIDGVNQGH